jgi:hypothetical protein
MDPPGMVHALTEIHRLLKPGGVLVDIHPVPYWSFVRVVRSNEVLFESELPEGYWEGVLYAEKALASSTARGQFVAENTRDFGFMTYAPSIEILRAHRELMEAYDQTPIAPEVLDLQDRVFDEASAMLSKLDESARVAYHEKGRMTRMVPQ